MPTSAPGPASPVVVRAASAERLAFPDGSTMTLLADSTATGGALSIHRTTLPDGADGAGFLRTVKELLEEPALAL